jgi:hypothetical protein
MGGSLNRPIGYVFDCWFWDMTKSIWVCLFLVAEFRSGLLLADAIPVPGLDDSTGCLRKPTKAPYVLRDAISCMNLMKSPSYYLRTEHERMTHFQELSVQIHAIIEYYRKCSVGFRPSCWAGVCGKTLEDMHHVIRMFLLIFGCSSALISST